MAGVTISISGVKELRRKLDTVKSQKEVRTAVSQATALVEGTARANCTVDTGTLRRSIHMRVEEYSRKVVGIVYTACEHGPYVEFGTGRRGKGSYPHEKSLNVALVYDPEWPGQVAQPFLAPALLTNRNRINKLIAVATISSTGGGK